MNEIELKAFLKAELEKQLAISIDTIVLGDETMQKTVTIFGILVRVPCVVPALPPPPTPAPPEPAAILSRSNLREILTLTCASFGYSHEELTGPVRTKMLVTARREFARTAQDRGYSLSEIGRALHRHHTSILSLLRK